MPVSIGRQIWRLAASVGIVAGVMALCRRLPHVNHTTVALTLLLAILGIATRWGSLQAIVAALVGGLEFDWFFLPPLGIGIGEPQHFVALVTFLATAITTSQLSVRAKHRTQEAIERRQEMEKLFDLGRAILQIDSFQATLSHIAEHVARIFELRGAALYHLSSGEIFRSGPEAGLIPDDLLREAAGPGRLPVHARTGLSVVPVRAADQAIGSLGVCGAPLSEPVLHSIAERLAICLERARAVEEAGRAEAARKSEELRSAVLDALSHDIKTPLTSIKAAVTSLLSDGSGDGAGQRELLTIVDEETDRLNLLVNQAVEMARIDAGVLRLERSPHDVGAIITASLKELGHGVRTRPVEVELPPSLPPADIDFQLVKQVLKQLLDNAIKYSPPGSPLVISSKVLDGLVVINVADSGAGIPEQEQQRIFEKFYRGPTKKDGVPGTGLGLAIAKSIVEAHGGSIWVTSRPGAGSVFHVALPVSRDSLP